MKAVTEQLTQRIVEVLRKHRMVPCSCSAVGEPTWHWALCEGCDWESHHFNPGEGVSREDVHGRHVAEAVVAALPAQELTTRLESLAAKYEANHLSNHARGVLHAAREFRAWVGVLGEEQP